MKASKLIAAVVSGAAALALVGGIAYAMEPDHDPATLPMPEAAQDVIDGIAIPRLVLDPRPASTPLIVAAAMNVVATLP